MRVIKDDYGEEIKAGDTIRFSYGIPPVRVVAPVVDIGGVLWVSTPDHNPKSAKLSYVKKYFNFWKEQP